MDHPFIYEIILDAAPTITPMRRPGSVTVDIPGIGSRPVMPMFGETWGELMDDRIMVRVFVPPNSGMRNPFPSSESYRLRYKEANGQEESREILRVERVGSGSSMDGVIFESPRLQID